MHSGNTGGWFWNCKYFDKYVQWLAFIGVWQGYDLSRNNAFV